VFGSIARLFVALGIVACCGEVDDLLARLTTRGR
jgi:hypothetical protein